MHKSKKILVTGGTGFVGSYLLRYLVQEGYQNIRAIRRPTSDPALIREVVDRIEWVEGNILDTVFLEESMADIHQVYHCAAMVSFDPRDRGQMMQVNVEGTTNMVNAALFTGVEKFLYVSSIASLGRSRYQPVISERTYWVRNKYNSNYAVSKYLAEQEVWRGMAEGLAVAIVNPSVILGSGRWDNGALQLFKKTWQNFPFYPTGATGFVDVRDVARFMIRLMESEISNERYILNSDNLSFQTLLHLLADHLGKKRPGIKVTPFLQKLAWRLEWLRCRLLGTAPFLTRETALTSVRQFSYRNDKSRAALNFAYIPIQETIAEAAAQFTIAAGNGFEPKVLPLRFE